jgi:hypothetical protein
MKHLVLAALAAATIAGSMAAGAAAVDPVVVDLSTCARAVAQGGGGGSWTVPAGVPVTVTNLTFVTGTHGLATMFLGHQSTISGTVRNGVPDVADVSGAWSDPQPLDPSAQHPGWITTLPDLHLAPLAPGETALAGMLITLDQPVQIAFPPVGQVNFGPFHLTAGDTLGQLCAITAV